MLTLRLESPTVSQELWRGLLDLVPAWDNIIVELNRQTDLEKMV
jgi:hypothetical protein